MSHPARSKTDVLSALTPGTPASRAGGLPARHLRITPTERDVGVVRPTVSSPPAVDAPGRLPPSRALVGATPVMQSFIRAIERVGRTDVPVLLTGERGTGKALAARTLHESSARHAGPFVTFNCAAVSSEAEAVARLGRDRGSLFEAAHGGTLLLEEIGALGPLAQAALLQALDAGDTLPMGGDRSTPVDVRLIATTTRALADLAAAGRFREGLLHRLSVMVLTVPALRDRRPDIPMLAEHFLRLCAARHDLPVPPLGEEARATLEGYDWPGNVRELRQVIEGALVLCDGATIMPTDLPARVARTMPALTIDGPTLALPFVEARERALRAFDRAFLGAALARNDGNIARTARALGLHRQSLQKLLVRRDMRDGEIRSGT